MNIETKADWIKAAAFVIPLLPAYMESQRSSLDNFKYKDVLPWDLYNNEDWKGLYRYFSAVWNWVPDNPGCHRHPFGYICDLCSEAWVLDE